jgi:hypothetical protein
MSSDVRLRLCKHDDCQGGFYPPDGTLAPGDQGVVNVSSAGVPAVYLVQGPTGTRLGCLPFVAPDWRPDVTVRVSEKVPCRDDLDENAFWPSRWEQQSP